MPIANYTTKVPAGRSMTEIQDMLVKHGAEAVLAEYEKGTGRIDGMSFKISMNGKSLGFRLPIKWKEAQKVMLRQGFRRGADDDVAYRVAWRILRDWVRAQMALRELDMVQIEEIFLPYAITKSGQTIYEVTVENPSLLLGSGSS